MAKYLVTIDRSSIKGQSSTEGFSTSDKSTPGESRTITDHSYSYNETIVECHHCLAQFSYTRLKSEPISSEEEGNTYSHNICPICGKDDCCELHFEDLSDVFGME